MAEKNKNNFVVNDKTYVKKPEIHYSYKFQPYVKDLGGSPGKNITQEDRNKRLKHENNVNAVRNVVKGLNNTFGKAISGASAFYGGGWALNRLLHLNKPSTLGQFFGRYVLPANIADNVSDGVELIFDPSVEGAVDLGSGVVLGRFKDLSKPVRLVGELIGQGANINNMKNGGEMNILEFLKNGSGIHIKKKNRGSFTRWCGGNVTEECIRRGKASSNPKIRKKATFADNARHFKHKSGGLIIKAKFGNNINWNNVALIGLDLYNGISLLSSLNKAKNNYFEAQNNNIKLKVNEAIANYDTNQFVLQQMGLLNSLGDNGGLIVEQLYRKLAEDMIRNKVENTAKIEALNDKNKFMYQYNDLLLLILGLLLNSGMSILGNFKKSSNGAPTSTLS